MRLLRFIGIGLLVILPTVVFGQEDQSNQFVPLLPSLPGISELSNAESLAPFLTQLYKICIGAAAVLAVLQLIRAGVMYMGGDSITEKKEARNLITLSIVGLLLVLTPVIVFNIINPDILKLDINTRSLEVDLRQIQLNLSGTPEPRDNNPGDLGGSWVAPNPTAANCPVRYGNATQIDPNDQQQVTCCGSQSNTFVTCRPSIRRTANIEAGDFNYCGCTANPAAPVLTYYSRTLVLVRTPDSRTGQQVRYGDTTVAPTFAERADTYVRECRAAGGRVASTTVGSAYIDCNVSTTGVDSTHTPVGTLNPTNNYNMWQCTQKRATCVMRAE